MLQVMLDKMEGLAMILQWIRSTSHVHGIGVDVGNSMWCLPSPWE